LDRRERCRIAVRVRKRDHSNKNSAHPDKVG
jgi:hypothetical protein